MLSLLLHLTVTEPVRSEGGDRKRFYSVMTGEHGDRIVDKPELVRLTNDMDGLFGSLKDLMELCFREVLPSHILREPAVLVALEGAAAQMPHTDVARLQAAWCRHFSDSADTPVPLSVMLAVQGDTTFLTWEKSHRTVWDFLERQDSSQAPYVRP
jgi:hypothetical protein